MRRHLLWLRYEAGLRYSERGEIGLERLLDRLRHTRLIRRRIVNRSRIARCDGLGGRDDDSLAFEYHVIVWLTLKNLSHTLFER